MSASIARCCLAQTANWERQTITPEPPSFEVVGRQFEWRIRYAGADKQLDTADDIIGEVNELHAPKDVRMVGSLKAADVLHSFFIPALRLKNDMILELDRLFGSRRTNRATTNRLHRVMRLGPLQNEGTLCSRVTRTFCGLP